ncbi:MAG: ATP-binding cassette domain-containing protein [Candidatus Dormibacteria bacterium]
MTGAGAAPSAVRVTGLRKAFQSRRGRVEALRGVDLSVAAGEIYGLLGPNGAGKTTALRILTTLMPADAGEVVVAGLDVRRRPAEVRRHIGYVGQLGGADTAATGRENLILQGRLYGMGRVETERRATELIDLLDIGPFSGRIVSTYSGGQRRRLEVALGIVHRPAVLFLDEPTLGLDPQNRANLWDQLRGLRGMGTTVLLTTHYLDEADQLSDRVAIIDNGLVVAEGTPEELKRRHPAAVTITTRPGPADLAQLAGELAQEPLVRGARSDGGAIRVDLDDPTTAMAAIFDRLRDRRVDVVGVTLREPSLDDVFLHETGRSLRDAADPGEAGRIAS